MAFLLAAFITYSITVKFRVLVFNFRSCLFSQQSSSKLCIHCWISNTEIQIEKKQKSNAGQYKRLGDHDRGHGKSFFRFFRETENGFGGPSQVAAMTEMELDGRHPEFILEFILDSWSGNNVG